MAKECLLSLVAWVWIPTLPLAACGTLGNMNDTLRVSNCSSVKQGDKQNLPQGCCEGWSNHPSSMLSILFDTWWVLRSRMWKMPHLLPEVNNPASGFTPPREATWSDLLVQIQNPEPAMAKHPPTFPASLPAVRNFSQEHSLHEGLPIFPCLSLRFWALRLGNSGYKQLLQGIETNSRQRLIVWKEFCST